MATTLLRLRHFAIGYIMKGWNEADLEEHPLKQSSLLSCPSPEQLLIVAPIMPVWSDKFVHEAFERQEVDGFLGVDPSERRKWMDNFPWRNNGKVETLTKSNKDWKLPNINFKVIKKGGSNLLEISAWLDDADSIDEFDDDGSGFGGNSDPDLDLEDYLDDQLEGDEYEEFFDDIGYL